MKLIKGLVVVLILAVGLCLWGCCGGKKETIVVPQSQSTTTLGDELKDLDDAHKKGAITKEEYESTKKKIIEQRTKGK
ncbi:MAG: SHOCT domain-containing protein [Deltaproteobacteria bacterium]|nr:SHOCT domain-containing protein [Deltaproteobacteria bacterium]